MQTIQEKIYFDKNIDIYWKIIYKKLITTKNLGNLS